jgi:hypothetical protein
MDIEEIIAKAAAAATAAAKSNADKTKRKEQASLDGPLAKRAAAQEKARTMLEAARAKEQKAGLDLAEEFLRDISPNILRMITREDANRLLNSGVRLVIHFSKTDASGTIPSFTISRGSVKTDRTIHRNSIEQWADSEKMFLDRYRQQGGSLTASSHHELMLELIEVNKENKRLRLMLERAGEKAMREADGPMPPGSTEVSQPVSTTPDAKPSEVRENIPATEAVSS